MYQGKDIGMHSFRAYQEREDETHKFCASTQKLLKRALERVAVSDDAVDDDDNRYNRNISKEADSRNFLPTGPDSDADEYNIENCILKLCGGGRAGGGRG